MILIQTYFFLFSNCRKLTNRWQYTRRSRKIRMRFRKLRWNRTFKADSVVCERASSAANLFPITRTNKWDNARRQSKFGMRCSRFTDAICKMEIGRCGFNARNWYAGRKKCTRIDEHSAKHQLYMHRSINAGHYRSACNGQSSM